MAGIICGLVLIGIAAAAVAFFAASGRESRREKPYERNR
jgi:hypothetical protein